MSTAVSMPRLPSMSEIEKAMREKLPGLVIYNPGTEWLQLEVFGLTHLWACPDLNGAVEPHPVTGVPTTCDGRTIIRGRFLNQKDSSGKNIEGQDAPAMVKLLVSPDKYGQMGMVWLPGVSVEEDDRLKSVARSVYENYQYQKDEMLVSRRAEFKSNWTKSGLHKGEPCPPPTAAETAAMDRLQARKRARQWKYECDVEACPGYAVNEWDRFVAHMKAAHDITPKRDHYDGEVKGLAEESVINPTEPAPSPRSGIEVAAEKFVEEIVGEADEKPDVPLPRRVRK